MSATDVSPPPPKLDPETLVLRARPRPVVRFRRSAIIGISAASAVALTATAFMALKPQTFLSVAREEGKELVGGRTPDALAAAPQSYDTVPKLGPPLPGDLGRPILEHQRSLGTGAVDGEAVRLQAVESERQRRAAEAKAARESGVMVSRANAVTVAPVSNSPDVAPVAVPAGEGGRIALDPERDPGGQQRKLDFVAARDGEGDVNPHLLRSAASPWMLSAGSIIPASLITGLNSDLPGLVTAQVTERVYDSVKGRTVLIPQGARLVGRYDSVVAFGQSRALVVWQRIILPDGSSIRIDNLPATDASGYAGLADRVDFHSWSLLKGIGLATLFGVGAELALDSSEGDLVKAIRESTEANADRAGQQVISKNLDIQPTIRIRPGTPLRVVVHKDIVLQPWSKDQ